MEKIVDFIYESFELVLFVGFIFIFIFITMFGMNKFNVFQDYISNITIERNIEDYTKVVLGAYVKTMIFEEEGDYYIETSSGEIILNKENYSSYINTSESYSINVKDGNKFIFTKK